MSEPLPEEPESDRRVRKALEVLQRWEARPPEAVPTARRVLERAVRDLMRDGRASRALDLVNAANAADPEWTWRREPDRGRLMWRGGEAARRALEGPVIRIDHGPRETLVRGVDPKDARVRAELRKLGFRKSWKSKGTWRLRKKTTALDRLTRVSRLSAVLDRLGRDRISEGLYKELGEQVREQRAAQARTLVAGFETEVAEAVRRAEQEGAYRRALAKIDAVHAELAGHDVPAPWAAERAELLRQARWATGEITRRLTQAMQEDRPQAAMVLFEELEATAPPEDMNLVQLNRLKAALIRRDADGPRPASPRATARAGAEAAARAAPGSEQVSGQGPTASPPAREEPPAPSPAAMEPAVLPAPAEPIPQERLGPVPASAGGVVSIDVGDAEPYSSYQASQKAAWWIEENGISAWEGTVTQAEAASSRELPAEDTIALAEAVRRVRGFEPAPSLMHTADGYGRLAGAAVALAERVGLDRLHLAQVATMAQEHGARLQATHAVRVARAQGEDPFRVEQELQVAPYADLKEARAVQYGIDALMRRWRATVTAGQMRDSFAPGEDAALLSEVRGRMPVGPPADSKEVTAEDAQRYFELSQAAGRLNLRLEADAGRLERLGHYSARHAARLVATYMRQVRPAQAGAERAPRARRAAGRGAEQGVGVG